MLQAPNGTMVNEDYHSMISIARTPGVYVIKCLKTGKFYIGSSTNLRQRLKQHRTDLRGQHHANKHLQAAWDKYGEKQFEFKVLEYCEKDMTLIREQHFLDVLRPYERGIGFNVGMNATAAATGIKASDETRAKLSEKRRGRKQSIEQVTNSANARRGIKRTPEQCARIKEGVKNGRKRSGIVTEETREKLRIANTGKTLSAEHKAKLSVAHTGKKMSSVSHEKLMNNLCRFSYIVISPEGNEFTTINLRQFSLEHSLRPTRMYEVIKGRRHHYKGWKVRLIK